MELQSDVFSSRERAEEAVSELLDRKVRKNNCVPGPESETEAKTVGKELGAHRGFMARGPDVCRSFGRHNAGCPRNRAGVSP